MRTTLVMLSLLVLAACGRTAEAPPDLVGRWRTTAPAHRGARLEIGPQRILFGAPDGTFTMYQITAVDGPEGSVDGPWTITYDDGTGEQQLWLTYESRDGGLLRLGKQEHMAWTRERRH